jgi:hypothetical protein
VIGIKHSKIFWYEYHYNQTHTDISLSSRGKRRFFRYHALMARTFRENLRDELDYQNLTVKELSARTAIPKSTLDCYLGARAKICLYWTPL